MHKINFHNNPNSKNAILAIGLDILSPLIENGDSTSFIKYRYVNPTFDKECWINYSDEIDAPDK